MSYVGSARRATAWARGIGSSAANVALAILAWSLAVIFIVLMWFAVLPVWYFFTLVIFGWFLIPFRLIMRRQRRQQHLNEVQLATMQAMMVQQQTQASNYRRRA